MIKSKLNTAYEDIDDLIFGNDDEPHTSSR